MRWLVCVIACCVIAAAHAEAVEARKHVREIAQVIEARFYDADRGREIAKGLVKDAEQGAFDGIADPQDLSARLTERLRSVDGHFSVKWGEASQPMRRRAARGSERPVQVEHGFGRVERLDGNVGYIELLEAAHFDFADASSPERRKADAVLADVRGSDAIVFDLRQNAGEPPAMIGYLISAFVSPTANVYNTFHTRDEVFSERPAIPYSHPMLDTPLYVLVGPGTASAAESLAYSLQACGRATIVGEPSAGAANPGLAFSTESGYSVFVATGAPRNPITQGNWEGKGVQPDVRVPAADALREAQQLALRTATD
jgi:C-terminal processing protease CtpA/Prc